MAMSAYREYVCVVCGFVYNEADGLPEEGFAPGTRWEDIPASWVCPECGATKDEFEMVEV
jgi:rubredoxin